MISETQGTIEPWRLGWSSQHVGSLQHVDHVGALIQPGLGQPPLTSIMAASSGSQSSASRIRPFLVLCPLSSSFCLRDSPFFYLFIF